MKLIKNNQSFMVILPIAIIRAKGWQHNQPLDCKITEKGDLLIKEK